MKIIRAIKRFFKGPEVRQYRVTHGGDDVWRLNGWYMEMRGPGGGILGWFWMNAHRMPYDNKLLAERDAVSCAKRDGGVFLDE